MGGSSSKRDTEVKIITLGSYKSGKSSLINRLRDMYGELPPKEKQYVIGQGMDLLMWDYDGRGHYEYDSVFYVRGSSGIIYVIDSTEGEDVDRVVDALLRNVLEDENVCNTTIMVCANKQDLEGAVGPDVVEEIIKQHHEIKRDNTLFVMPTSAINENDDSVKIAFRYFFKTMKRKAKGKIQTGLVPRAWETAEKVAEDSDGEDEDGKDVTKAKKGKKKFLLKDPVHMFKSLLIR